MWRRYTKTWHGQGTRAADQWRKPGVSDSGLSGQPAGTLTGYGQLLLQTLGPVGLWVSVSDGDG